MIAKPAAKACVAPWGLLTSLDIYGCNPVLIRDADRIKRYVIELCELIEMTRFGDCHVVHFGKDERVAGYSVFQLIETSHISGHFANLDDSAYIDIFSCKPYEPGKAADFSKTFFEGKEIKIHVTERM